MTQYVKLPSHYPLTNEEWLKTVQELKPAEIAILYHLRTITPFGEHPVPIGVRELAKTLKMNPGTVSRALKRLDQLEYIDLKLLQVEIKVLSKGMLFDRKHGSEKDADECCLQTTLLPVDNKDDQETTPTIATQHQRSPRNTQPPEPFPDESSTSLRSFKNLKDFKDSLSTGTENFLSEEKSQNVEEGSLEFVGEVISSIAEQMVQPTHAVQDQYSAPTAAPVENFNTRPIRKVDADSAPAQPLPLWRSNFNSSGIKPEFVEWVRKWLGTIPPERDRSRGDALAYIRNQESSGDLSVLKARAEEWLLSEQTAIQHQRQAIAFDPMAIAEQMSQGNPDAVASFRRMQETLAQVIQQRSTPEQKPPPEPLDCSEVLTDISICCDQLGWEPEQSRAWFIENFGQSGDRLDAAQLFEAAERLEMLRAVS
jgi:hypothetical protein